MTDWPGKFARYRAFSAMCVCFHKVEKIFLLMQTGHRISGCAGILRKAGAKLERWNFCGADLPLVDARFVADLALRCCWRGGVQQFCC